MRFMKPLLGVIVSALLSASAMAATIDLAGVKVEDSAVVGGAKLPLNGAGIRVKFLKIYVGELFVGKKVHWAPAMWSPMTGFPAPAWWSASTAKFRVNRLPTRSFSTD